MAKKKIEGLGDQAVDKFFEQPAAEQEQGLPEVPKSNIGRPRTIYREYETSSEEGLPGNDTRWTVVVDKELKEALKDYQNTSEYPSMKALINDMVKEFLKSKGAMK